MLSYSYISNSFFSWYCKGDKLYTFDNVVVLWLLYPYRIITLGSNKHNTDGALEAAVLYKLRLIFILSDCKPIRQNIQDRMVAGTEYSLLVNSGAM